MATFVHLGDFHADTRSPRDADRYAVLDQIIDECRSLPTLAAWLWPGDLFDGDSSPEDRNALDRRLQQMAAVAPVLVDEGNHDRRRDLRGFANLATAWPIVVVDGQPALVPLRLATGQMATIWALPYPHKAGLVGAGVAHADLSATAAALFDATFLHAAAELEAARQRGELTLFVFHANIAGAVTSAGQPNIGRELELTHGLLDRLGPIYKGGNHIHRPQEIAGAWYAGSLARNDWGEIEEKRYLLVDVAPDSSYTVTSRPIAIPPMYHVTGELTRTAFVLDPDQPIAYRGVDEGLTEDWTGVDVRVRWRYPASAREALDPSLVARRFAGARRLKIESVAIPDRELRAPAVITAKTLPEKLAAMRPEGVLPPSVIDKLSALEQLERDQVLAGVRTWLTALEQGERAEEAA